MHVERFLINTESLGVLAAKGRTVNSHAPPSHPLVAQKLLCDVS